MILSDPADDAKSKMRSLELNVLMNLNVHVAENPTVPMLKSRDPKFMNWQDADDDVTAPGENVTRSVLNVGLAPPVKFHFGNVVLVVTEIMGSVYDCVIQFCKLLSVVLAAAISAVEMTLL
jgi:hypothetical protein